MAALDFPSAPTDGQLYSANGLTFKYSLARLAWEPQSGVALNLMPGLPVLGEATASGSPTSITIPIPEGYRDLLISISGRLSTAATVDEVQMRCNGDTGNNYNRFFSVIIDTVAARGDDVSYAASAMYVGQLPGSSAPADYAGSIQATIPNYLGTSHNKLLRASGNAFYNTAAQGQRQHEVSSQWRSKNKITSLTFFTTAGGAFTDGTVITVYGRGGSAALIAPSSGTTFPTLPSTGQRFFRTDRGIEYYWDGTRWLSLQIQNIVAQLYDQASSPVGATVSGAMRVGNPFYGTYDFYAIDLILANYIATTGTWTFNWNAQTGGSSVLIASANTTGDTAASFIGKRVAVNSVITSTVPQFQIDMIKTSGGNVYPQLILQGRLIG
jgi:hypothetical protein